LALVDQAVLTLIHQKEQMVLTLYFLPSLLLGAAKAVVVVVDLQQTDLLADQVAAQEVLYPQLWAAQELAGKVSLVAIVSLLIMERVAVAALAE
jgi:hypothetical protein